VQAQTDELEGTFGGEDADEDGVDDVQRVLELVRLLVVLEAHQYHVEQDHDHDEDVELLVHHDGEEETLYEQLQRKHTNAMHITVLLLFRKGGAPYFYEIQLSL